MTSGRRADLTTRWLAAGGVVAPVVDVLVIVWLGALDPNYSHVRQVISELGETGRRYAAVFSVWCVLWGLLFAGFAVALARGLRGHKGSWLGPGALLLMAAGGILSSFFPCDAGCAGETASAKAHILNGEVAMAATVVAPFLVWVAMRRSVAWRRYRALTLAAGGLLLAVTGWLALCHYAGLGRAACAFGAGQRLFFGILYVWVEVIAVRLWSRGSAAEPA